MAENQAVKAFIDVKNEIIKDRKEDRQAAVTEILRLLQAQADGKALPEGALLAIQAVAADLGTGGTVRVRETYLVDRRATSKQDIAVAVLPNPSLPATFNFGFQRGTAERTVGETEIEAVYAFPASGFAEQLLSVVRGDNAIAILNSLKDLMAP